MAGPLEGIRVVEWAAYAHAPVMGVILSDLGADVIKIEERGRGEPLRGMAPMIDTGTKVRSQRDYPTLATGVNAAVENTNRNKKSISLDLTKKKAREVVYKLVEKADVFYTCYGQTRAAKVGLDYETLSKINPKLVYANATGYGPRGPDTEKRAFDHCGQARSGMMTSCGERNAPPSRVVGAPIDCTGATIGAMGIMAALINRLRTGEGQMTNTSLLGSAIWIQMINIQTGLFRAGTREHLGMARDDRQKPKHPLNTWYECRDGKWILLGETEFDRFWGEFCQVMGITEPEYTDVNMNLLKNDKPKVQQMVAYLEKLFATRPMAEWIKYLDEKKANFVYSPVNEVSDLLHDEQVLANNYFTDFDHPAAGHIKLVNHPVEYSKTPARIRSGAPEYSQHTDEVLSELGYSREDTDRLRDEGVI